MNASTVFVCDSCAEAWRRAEAAERERDEARAELRGVRNFYRDVSSSLRAHMRALEAAEEELKIAVSHNAQLMIEAATVRADASIPWDSTPAENMRLRERIKALEAALRKSAQGWENVVELGLIPRQHRATAEALRDECRAALGAQQ